MKIFKFNNFINEDLTTDLVSRLSDENKDMKEEIIRMIQKSVNSDDENLFMQKIESIIKDPKESSIEGLIQDADIYEFYLKFRNEVDEVLSNNKFFEKLQEFQKENNCISLYDLIVKGTLESVNYLVNQIKQELTGNSTQE